MADSGKMEDLGKHIVFDFIGGITLHKYINDLEVLRFYMEEAILKVGATIIHENWHRFEPHGISIVYLLAESHFTVHTFPERNAMTFDMYTCGDCDPMKAYYYMKEMLEPVCDVYQILNRGDM